METDQQEGGRNERCLGGKPRGHDAGLDLGGGRSGEGQIKMLPQFSGLSS